MSIHFCVTAAESKGILDRDSSTVLSLSIMRRPRSQLIGFGCFCGVFGGGGVPGGIYRITHPIYNAVPFRANKNSFTSRDLDMERI